MAQEEEFVDMAQGVLQYYTDLMSGIPRLQTQGEMMRFMFDKFTDETYEIGDVERELSNLNNESQKGFFSRYIVGAERLPLAQYLELANIETIQENGQTVFRIREESDEEESEIRRGLFGR